MQYNNLILFNGKLTLTPPVTTFVVCFSRLLLFLGSLYCKTCVYNSHSQKLVFKTMQVKSIAKCSKGSILQFFYPSLSYHLSLRVLFCLFVYLFCLFLSVHFTQVLMYCKQYGPRSDSSMGSVYQGSYCLK